MWAYASLLHLPKNKIESVINNIWRVLDKNGVFFLGMKEGDTQGIQNYPAFKCERYLALYQDCEIRDLLFNKFEILKFSRKEVSTTPYLNYVCRKLSK